MLTAVSISPGAAATSATQVARNDFVKQYVCGDAKCRGIIEDAGAINDKQCFLVSQAIYIV